MTAHPMDEALRVVFYSHDSQGLGHFRRNKALAQALVQHLPELTGREVTGLLVNGVAEANPSSLPPGFDVVTLPAISKAEGAYGARRLDVDLDAMTEVRGEIFRATLLSFRPDLVVVDRHAFGVGGELQQGLAALRAELPQAKVVLGLREVLDSPEVVAREWQRTPVELVRACYDQIWVYGDPRVHDATRTGEIPLGLHDLVRHLGVLSHGRAEELDGLDVERPFLLTTAGGGSDGLALCLAGAAALVPEGHRHVVVTGPQMSSQEYDSVVAAARPGTQVVRSVPDAAGLIRRAAASVSMAGYNTVAETLATEVPALLVPREWPRREQLIRARSLARAGAVDLLRERDLTPEAITRWWRANTGQRVDRSEIALDGLSMVAVAAAELLDSSATELHHAS